LTLGLTFTGMPYLWSRPDPVPVDDRHETGLGGFQRCSKLRVAGSNRGHL
jgi:hypothetical protein